MNCTIVLTSGPRKSQLCERPCPSGQSICTMHLNHQKQQVKEKEKKKTWDTLPKSKQKLFAVEIDHLVEHGTWREQILAMVARYQLQEYFPKTEIECCIQAYRVSQPKRSITYKNGIMYVSDPHKGRCNKITENVPELTEEEWRRLLQTLPQLAQVKIMEDLEEIHSADIDALLYHYRVPTTSFLWNEKAIELIHNYRL